MAFNRAAIQSALNEAFKDEVSLGSIHQDKITEAVEQTIDESEVSEEYIESMNSIEIDMHLDAIKELWNDWKKGPMTERSDIAPAGKELTHYILLWMRKTFK